MPERILDLFVEFRNLTNGRHTPCGAGLLGALTYFGLDAIGAIEKKEMQEAIGSGHVARALRAERNPRLLRAATSTALERLLPAMLPHIDLPRALLRGRYMAAAAAMEYTGVPIDMPTLAAAARALGRHSGRSDRRDRCGLRRLRWPHLQGRSLGAAMAGAKDIPWPRLESGRLDLSDDTFRQMAKAYPSVSPMRELRSALIRPAAQRSRRRQRWPQSHDTVGVPIAHRAQST